MTDKSISEIRESVDRMYESGQKLAKACEMLTELVLEMGNHEGTIEERQEMASRGLRATRRMLNA